ncbi:MAG: 4'-phosphopantetheinyl transferase family protein [Lysobacter sp.]
MKNIEIWWLSLEGDDGLIASYAALLSPDEKVRADRYRFERDRRRFIACRAQLRSLLTQYIGGSPAQISFQYNPFGKPALTPTPASSTVEFNVSNSGAYAACAVAARRRVGVDLEQLNPSTDLHPVADEILSPPEHAVFRNTSCAGERSRQLLRIWTRKEALLKAWGTGLSTSMRDVTVGAAAGAYHWLSAAGGSACRQAWSLLDYPTPDGYIGAVAVEGTNAVVQFNGLWSARNG